MNKSRAVNAVSNSVRTGHLCFNISTVFLLINYRESQFWTKSLKPVNLSKFGFENKCLRANRRWRQTAVNVWLVAMWETFPWNGTVMECAALKTLSVRWRLFQAHRLDDLNIRMMLTPAVSRCQAASPLLSRRAGVWTAKQFEWLPLMNLPPWVTAQAPATF